MICSQKFDSFLYHSIQTIYLNGNKSITQFHVEYITNLILILALNLNMMDKLKMN